ncbi:hypothetical protein CR513_07046, partial [Mucuna pruriens]
MSLMSPMVLSNMSDVVIMADRIAAGLQSWCALNNAATPATWGHAMDVPLNKLKLLKIFWDPNTSTGTFEGHAAKTDVPGAVMSGFNTNGQLLEGPRELRLVKNGSIFVLTHHNVAPHFDKFLHFVAQAHEKHWNMAGGEVSVIERHASYLVSIAKRDVPRKGPSFPADVDTKMPLSMAANVAIATGSSYKGISSKPNDKERTSTPSDIALSIAAIISDE